MPASIVSHSKPFNMDDEVNVQDMIIYCARVSNPGNQTNTTGGEKLIKYLIENQHWSPFEMVSICIYIETTRDIARQILRHRSFSFQEFSQRYAVASVDMVSREARLQDKKNRQNSIELCESESESESNLKNQWIEKQEEVAELSKTAYQWAISSGIAKEQARAVLPEGMTMSRMYMNGTLRSWIHYIQLRSGNGTQKEHREIALECAAEIAKIFPMISEFLSK